MKIVIDIDEKDYEFIKSVKTIMKNSDTFQRISADLFKSVKNGEAVSRYPTSFWKRHIVDNGYNADWKCTKCGYISKLDFPPMECPKCMGGNN